MLLLKGMEQLFKLLHDKAIDINHRTKHIGIKPMSDWVRLCVRVCVHTYDVHTRVHSCVHRHSRVRLCPICPVPQEELVSAVEEINREPGLHMLLDVMSARCCTCCRSSRQA